MTQNKKFELFLQNLSDMDHLSLKERNQEILKYVQAVESYYTIELTKLKQKNQQRIFKLRAKTNLQAI